MLAEIPTEEFRLTMDRCAEDLLWEASVDRPPVDAFHLASRLGMTVARDDQLGGRARFVRLAAEDPKAPNPTEGSEAIAIAPDDRSERRHFAVAHEIGESRAQRVYAALGVDPRETAATAREGVANALAGRLLVPRRWFGGVWADLDGDLYALKDVFATASYELLARRALECVRSPLVVTITDQGRVTWRRWNLSGSAPPRVRLELDCQAYAHETGQPAWGDGRDEAHGLGGAPLERVRSWPVHEPGWRREVTFTELVGEEPSWF